MRNHSSRTWQITMSHDTLAYLTSSFWIFSHPGQHNYVHEHASWSVFHGAVKGKVTIKQFLTFSSSCKSLQLIPFPQNFIILIIEVRGCTDSKVQGQGRVWLSHHALLLKLELLLLCGICIQRFVQNTHTSKLLCGISLNNILFTLKKIKQE